MRVGRNLATKGQAPAHDPEGISAGIDEHKFSLLGLEQHPIVCGNQRNMAFEGAVKNRPDRLEGRRIKTEDTALMNRKDSARGHDRRVHIWTQARHVRPHHRLVCRTVKQSRPVVLADKHQVLIQHKGRGDIEIPGNLRCVGPEPGPRNGIPPPARDLVEADALRPIPQRCKDERGEPGWCTWCLPEGCSCVRMEGHHRCRRPTRVDDQPFVHQQR